ncbi:recombinase family protein [Mycobacterium intracellulare]|uniref:recombinase family protein n=1 Tax=Mycobacterium intracellulare TaxID=1767 RepID=UPI0035593169
MSHENGVDRALIGQRVGYTRVSTITQTLDQQNDALTAAGVSKTFSDIMSGGRDDRPGLAALMAYVREGDTVVVWKLDRLGRNTLHILETVKALTNRGVKLISTSDGIDSSTPAGRMMIGVLGSLAEYERELVKERTALKRAVSRANGTKFGRPRKVGDAAYIATAKRMKREGHTGRAIAKYLGVSRATAYRYLADSQISSLSPTTATIGDRHAQSSDELGRSLGVSVSRFGLGNG